MKKFCATQELDDVVVALVRRAGRHRAKGLGVYVQVLLSRTIAF